MRTEWASVPLRQLLTESSVRNRADLPLLSVVREKGVIRRSFDKSDNHNVIPEDLSNYKIVRAGQFVVNKMKAWQGSCGVSMFEGIVSPAYFVFDLRIDNPRFFNYAIRSRHFVDEFNRISKGIRVGQWDLDLQQLKYIPFSLPPREEQDQIVRFLDWKVSRINKLINAKRREIGLLQEQKRAVINATVTRGGEMWCRCALKTLCSITYGLGEPPQLTEHGIPIIRATNIERGKIVTHDLIKTLPEFLPADKDVILKEGNIIVVRSGAYAGDVGYITKEWEGSYVGYDMLLRVKEIDSKFLMYALLSNYVLKDQWYLQRVRSAQPHLNAENIGTSSIFLPPKEEQSIIVTLLDAKCAVIDRLTTVIQQQITLLNEYSSRLISDVVTGKIDVLGSVVPEYEIIEGAVYDESIKDEYSLQTEE